MLKIGKLFQGDRVIWVVFFFLCVISLIEVFSAASTLSYKEGSFWAPLLKQALFLGVGTLVVIGIHNVPCRFFKLVPLVFLPLSFLLLVLTLFSGKVTNGAQRYFEFMGFSFQPSELAKGAVITATALILAAMQKENGADRRAFKYILSLVLFFCAFIVTENLSTAGLLFIVVFLMMLIGRVPGILMGKLAGILVIAGGLGFATLVYVLPDNPDAKIYDNSLFHRALTWKERLNTHGDKAKTLTADSLDYDKDAQIIHANIAIASSNGVGRMPGNSVERDFLSQAFSDFIFAIIIEEMGLWGAFIVVFLYIVLVFRAGRIASRCERNFPAFLVMGLALLLAIQAMVNMMVAVGLFPVTGQPLPLISRGGTSTIITCAYIGMMLSISRYARKVPKEELDTVVENSDTSDEFRSDENLV